MSDPRPVYCMFCQTELPLWTRLTREVRDSLKAWGIKPVCSECLWKRVWRRRG